VVAHLHGLGILNARTLLVHAIWVDARDIEQIAASGAPIAHCPESNMKLGSGVAPVPDFLEAGVTVGIGTDGCASNNDLDLWGEMDTLAKLHKVQRLDPTVMDAATVVRMATMGGAAALGLADDIGSIEPGKQADLIVIDVDQPHLTPIYHPASHLVYAVRAGDVRHVMVGGKWAVRDRRLVGFDLDGLLAEGVRFAEKVKKIKV
jgi:5-methylthioadenosine/S-adenosylhomocysteine deaminase